MARHTAAPVAPAPLSLAQIFAMPDPFVTCRLLGLEVRVLSPELGAAATFCLSTAEVGLDFTRDDYRANLRAILDNEVRPLLTEAEAA